VDVLDRVAMTARLCGASAAALAASCRGIRHRQRRTRPAAGRLALTGVLTLIGIAAVQTPAAAAVRTDALEGVGSDLCLTIAGNSGLIGKAAVIEPCNGNSIQGWTQVAVGSDVMLKNVGSQLCLQRRPAGGQGSAIVQEPCNPGIGQQRWHKDPGDAGNAHYFVDTSSGGLFYVLAVSGGRTDPGAPVIAWPKELHHTEQQWWNPNG
jgi:Ricin-type beta-trefoil lectin domain